MLPQQWGAIEHRREVTKSVFKPAHKAVEKLGLTISDASNALYGLSDIISYNVMVTVISASPRTRVQRRRV